MLAQASIRECPLEDRRVRFLRRDRPPGVRQQAVSVEEAGGIRFQMHATQKREAEPPHLDRGQHGAEYRPHALIANTAALDCSGEYRQPALPTAQYRRHVRARRTRAEACLREPAFASRDASLHQGGASRQLRLTCQKLIGGHIRGVCCRFIEGLIADSDPGLSFDPVQAAQREDGFVPAVGYPGRCHGRAS